MARFSLCPAVFFSLFFLLLSRSPFVLCGSDGLLTYCDLNPNRLNRYGHLSGNIMRWTKSPINATFYTLRSGNGPNVQEDPKSFIPGSLNPIYLDVLDLDRGFIGLLLYAVNTEDDYSGKVGEFILPPFSPFQITETCEPVGSVISHQDAEVKPLSVRFYWTAPVGTGTVKFRILLKEGEQNKGNFFVPIKELILTEGRPRAEAAVQGQSMVFLGQPGDSCEETCDDQPMFPFCDLPGTRAINNSMALAEVADKLTACSYPLLNGCAAVAPSQDVDGFCSFKAPTAECNPQTRPNAAPTTCEAAAAGVARFCACSEFSSVAGSSTAGARPHARSSSLSSSASLMSSSSGVAAAPPPPLPAGSQTFQVSLNGPDFLLDGLRERPLTITLGTTIRFSAAATWSAIHPFSICSGDKGYCQQGSVQEKSKQIAPPPGTPGIKTLGAWFDWTPTATGVYSFGCITHEYIKGSTITILPASSSGVPTAALSSSSSIISSLGNADPGILWGILAAGIFLLSAAAFFFYRRNKRVLSSAIKVGALSGSSNNASLGGAFLGKSHRTQPSEGNSFDFQQGVGDLNKRHQKEHEESLEMNPIANHSHYGNRM